MVYDDHHAHPVNYNKGCSFEIQYRKYWTVGWARRDDLRPCSLLSDRQPVGPQAAPAELLVEPLLRMVTAHRRPVLDGDGGKRQRVGAGVDEHSGGVTEAATGLLEAFVLSPRALMVGLLEDRPRQRGTMPCEARGTRVNRFLAKWVLADIGITCTERAIYFTQIMRLPVAQVSIGLTVAGAVALTVITPAGRVRELLGWRDTLIVLLAVRAVRWFATPSLARPGRGSVTGRWGCVRHPTSRTESPRVSCARRPSGGPGW
jgi:hypothetical protein